MPKKRVLVLGAGLAGLRTALALVLRGYEVILIERAPMAGGCTSSWIDHRDPERGVIRKGQMQMNFNFYENLNLFAALIDDLSHWGTPEAAQPGWWRRGSSAYSDRLDGFHFFHEDGRRSHLSATPKSFMGRQFKKLPPPFSTLQMLWDFDGMPSMRDKLSTAKFFTLALVLSRQVTPPINDDWNFYGLCKSLGMSDEAIKAMQRICYSITNLSPADQVGPKFLHLFFQALMTLDPLGCRMMNDDCNPALVDKAVALLQKLGTDIRANCAVRDILVQDGRCRGVLVENYGAGYPTICGNCGLSFPAVGREMMCPACGSIRYTDRMCQPAGRREVIEADYVVSAIQPHQLAKIYADRDDHPLRYYDFFTALGEIQGAVLTVSRVFMDAKVTEGYNLTGLDRDYFSLNGAMDISHVMPKYRDASVFDTLSDDGRQTALMPVEVLKARLLADLGKIFPTMADAKVRKHLLAKIGPDVLYHRGVPRLNSRFLPKTGPKTPLADFFLAGDWVDEFELGKEAAVRSGVIAANAVLEAEGRSDLEPVLHSAVDPMVERVRNSWPARRIQRRYERIYRKQLPPHRG